MLLDVGDGADLANMTPNSGFAAVPGPPGHLRILQILSAPGWWIDIPEIDPDTGASFTTRVRCLALALCENTDGSTVVRPLSVFGELSESAYLSHEADSSIMSKYAKKKRTAPSAPGASGASGLGSGPETATHLDPRERGLVIPGVSVDHTSFAPTPVSTPTPYEDPDAWGIAEATGEVEEQHLGVPEDQRADPVRLPQSRKMVDMLLEWTSDVMAEQPDEQSLRATRSQLRWIADALGQGRRATVSEIEQLRHQTEVLGPVDRDLATAIRDLVSSLGQL
jgi:hypothetical protein